MRKTVALLLTVVMILSLAGCGSGGQTESTAAPEATAEAQATDDARADEKIADAEEDAVAEETDEADTDGARPACRYAGMEPEDVLAELTIEQKASQMVMAAIYRIDGAASMREMDYGCVLSKADALPAPEWRETIADLQQGAVESESGVPFIYGQDDLHGVNYSRGCVIFPHNIGLGAANDEKLMEEIGHITADEAKLCHMMWNYSPCVAQSEDPRWGRTYESYGSDLEMITRLSTAYVKAQVEDGMVMCPKHFFGDGNVEYGTGENSDVERIIDRGDAKLSDKEIKELLKVYQSLIDAGAQTIMISHSSVNGVKMHENKKYIDMLKNDMGFEGFISGDWDSVMNTSADNYEDQVINAVNAGVDMLMEVDAADEARDIIVKAADDGRISMERIDDAVLRILKVKKDAGLFEDPYLENLKTVQTETGSDEYREVARRAVQESLVLLKNKNDILPLKPGTKVYITGPSADNERAQCGGWTLDWNESPDEEVEGATSILEAFESGDYDIEVVDDASDADVVLLAIGEQSYAEWNGDIKNLTLFNNDISLDGTTEAMKESRVLAKGGKPVVACIVAGRNVIIDPFDKYWDGIVMCYLPGSEGEGVVDVLTGKAKFSGHLPSPWYSNNKQIGTNNCKWKAGYAA
ncbi:MAG: glycoside hydrolase family 3 protein [Eubacterium sp.]|nr:glycoside hydrolase family 3 protein [Eubacterium sp.]